MQELLTAAKDNAIAAASQAEAMKQLHAAAVLQESAIREQANATRGLLEHTPQIERAYLSATFARIMEEYKPYLRETLSGRGIPSPLPKMVYSGNIELRVSNHGKTPAEVTGCVVVYCEGYNIPDFPEYGERSMHRQHIGPGQHDVPLGVYNEPVNSHTGFIVYGRIYYIDIFKLEHFYGFIIDMTYGHPNPIAAPAAYTESN